MINMVGRNCKRTRERTARVGTLVLPVSRTTLNYLKDAEGVKLTLRHPDRATVRNLVLELCNLERTARADDSMELSARTGLPVENGTMSAPKKIKFSDGSRIVNLWDSVTL